MLPAWQIELNTPDMVAIQEADDPIIPPEIKDAPVLKVMENKKFKI